MSGYRLVAIDADGTLCGSDDQISERVRAAARACVAQGVEVVLATGRGPRVVRHLVEQLDIPMGLVMGNGALVCPALDEPALAARMLPPETACRVARIYQQAGHEPVIFDDPRHSEHVAYERETALLAPFLRRNAFRVVQVADFGAWLDHAVLMIGTFAPEPDMRALGARLAGELAGQVSVQPMLHPKYGLWICDTFAPDCDKWTGLRTYAAWRGVAAAQILAVGDGLNDIPMLRGAGWGVAMANAEPEVLAAADEVVADVAHDGVADVLERRILNSVRECR